MQMVNIKQLMVAAAIGFLFASGFSALAQQDNRTPPKEPRVVVQRPKEEGNQQRNSQKNNNDNNKDNGQNRGGKKP